MTPEHHQTDLLIIGAGFGGLWAAIAAREAGVKRILIVDKASIGRSGQSRQCAGATIHALPEDDLGQWLSIIAQANDGLCRRAHVAQLLEGSNRRLRRLLEWGVEYPRLVNGYFRLPVRGLPGVLMMVAPRYEEHVGGAALVSALRRPALAHASTRPRLMITELLQRDGRIAGAVGFDRSSASPVLIEARAVVLATADCSFRGHYVGVRATTGDGFALAYRRGARMSNMAFMCVNTGSPRFGFEGTGVAMQWGAQLLDGRGAPFMARHHPDAERAPLPAIVQAMAREAEAGNGPPFQLSMGAAFARRIAPALSEIGGFMPLNLRRLAESGVDLGQPQPWGAAVQALHGGVRVGLDGQSDLPGLFAAGTAAALDPGLFNGWSTFRAMGSGECAGRGAAAWLRDADPAPPRRDTVEAAIARAVAPLRPDSQSAGPSADTVVEALQRQLFATSVSILKAPDAMADALDHVHALTEDVAPRLTARDAHALAEVHEARNLLTVAELFLMASLARTESRSAHVRVDHPEPASDGPWWLNLRRVGGRVHVEREPVS